MEATLHVGIPSFNPPGSWNTWTYHTLWTFYYWSKICKLTSEWNRMFLLNKQTNNERRRNKTIKHIHKNISLYQKTSHRCELLWHRQQLDRYETLGSDRPRNNHNTENRQQKQGRKWNKTRRIIMNHEIVHRLHHRRNTLTTTNCSWPPPFPSSTGVVAQDAKSVNIDDCVSELSGDLGELIFLSCWMLPPTENQFGWSIFKI